MSSSAQLAIASSLRGIQLNQGRSHHDEPHNDPTQAIHKTRALVVPSSLSTDGPGMNNTSDSPIQPHSLTSRYTLSSSISQTQHMSIIPPITTTAHGMQGIVHNLKKIGTPRAIGALRNRSPAVLRHLTTPSVVHSTSRLNVNKVPSPIFPVTTVPHSKTAIIDEFKAQLVLNVTRAQRDVRLADKTLADCVLKQNVALVKKTYATHTIAMLPRLLHHADDPFTDDDTVVEQDEQDERDGQADGQGVEDAEQSDIKTSELS
ncbi:hypothetical protein P692DRAFT_20875189 [Suillus brevipes Sb2]|nr:hypothetical protein P692DRAFT_20875189 [Suillus brevipes Sb2]